MARVLVADDRAHVRGAVRRVLVQGGHQVWGARNGAEALALLDAIAFDLVISSVYMWVAGGMESLARRRSRAGGALIPARVVGTSCVGPWKPRCQPDGQDPGR